VADIWKSFQIWVCIQIMWYIKRPLKKNRSDVMTKLKIQQKATQEHQKRQIESEALGKYQTLRQQAAIDLGIDPDYLKRGDNLKIDHAVDIAKETAEIKTGSAKFADMMGFSMDRVPQPTPYSDAAESRNMMRNKLLDKFG